jgi:hypothetical protein
MEETGAIHPNNLEMIDLGRSYIRLGATVPATDKHHPEWTQLDEDDWKILHALLTKPIIDNQSAVDSSEPLSLLAQYAEATIKWYESQKKSSTPPNTAGTRRATYLR